MPVLHTERDREQSTTCVDHAKAAIRHRSPQGEHENGSDQDCSIRVRVYAQVIHVLCCICVMRCIPVLRIVAVLENFEDTLTNSCRGARAGAADAEQKATTTGANRSGAAGAGGADAVIQERLIPDNCLDEQYFVVSFPSLLSYA